MSGYWLITEPARGMSAQVDVQPGEDPDEVLYQYGSQYYPELAGARAEYGESESVKDLYEQVSGEQVRWVQLG